MKFLAPVVLGALVITAGCATVQPPGEARRADGQVASIAGLDSAIAEERDEAKLPGLVFRRGHAYLEAAERIRDLRGETGEGGRPSTEYGRLMLGALADFETVSSQYPLSLEAPEATFHLGVSYDHPNLSSIAVAARYYRLTVERYPGTEAAGKAREALAKIERKVKEVFDGRHGAR